MDLIKIGKYIASKRKALGLTQAQLAEKLGMSSKSVSKWERGPRIPRYIADRDSCGNPSGFCSRAVVRRTDHQCQSVGKPAQIQAICLPCMR
ncbi:MAG: helix-turn-helix domain-containing protein [Anaerovoracaceae bacterium]